MKNLTSQQRTALAGLFNVLVGVVVLGGLLWVLSTQGCQAQPVRQQAPFVATVGMTGSMRPAFKGGEHIRVDPAMMQDLRVGDVVVVQWAWMMPMHRILAIRRAANGELYAITKGDHNAERDLRVVTGDSLIGRVTLLP